MAKHDENKDLRLLGSIARINFHNKTISISKTQLIGIKRWGRIDFLVNHCGWVLVRDGGAIIRKSNTKAVAKAKSRKKELKQAAKDNSLKDKRKRR